MIDMDTTYSTKLNVDKDRQKLLLEKVLDEVRAFWQYTDNCQAGSCPAITITRGSAGAQVSITNVDNKIIY